MSTLIFSIQATNSKHFRLQNQGMCQHNSKQTTSKRRNIYVTHEKSKRRKLTWTFRLLSFAWLIAIYFMNSLLNAASSDTLSILGNSYVGSTCVRIVFATVYLFIFWCGNKMCVCVLFTYEILTKFPIINVMWMFASVNRFRGSNFFTQFMAFAASFCWLWLLCLVFL